MFYSFESKRDGKTRKENNRDERKSSVQQNKAIQWHEAMHKRPWHETIVLTYFEFKCVTYDCQQNNEHCRTNLSSWYSVNRQYSLNYLTRKKNGYVQFVITKEAKKKIEESLPLIFSCSNLKYLLLFLSIGKSNSIKRNLLLYSSAMRVQWKRQKQDYRIYTI